VTDAPKKGTVYLCRAPQAGAPGAQERGPWFINNGTEYDINQKVAVEGDVRWDASYSQTIEGDKRVIATNDLLRDHSTGVFPVQPSDPAYQYDRNPNSIAAQSLTYTLTAEPTVVANTTCVGGEIGVMSTGVALFSAFDAGGRDAGAWEVQDGCNGHPQMTSEYHYHTLSSCIADTSVNTVIGFALDGFPITGPKVDDDNILTTSDLDECHGITSTITLDGEQVETYHYVMTQDFPYSVSCFRAAATQPPGPPAGPPGLSTGMRVNVPEVKLARDVPR
jgi:YHYH protein